MLKTTVISLVCDFNHGNILAYFLFVMTVIHPPFSETLIPLVEQIPARSYQLLPGYPPRTRRESGGHAYPPDHVRISYQSSRDNVDEWSEEDKQLQKEERAAEEENDDWWFNCLK